MCKKICVRCTVGFNVGIDLFLHVCTRVNQCVHGRVHVLMACVCVCVTWVLPSAKACFTDVMFDAPLPMMAMASV